MTTFLSKQIDLLKKSGVDVIAIASNTPHIVFNELKSLTDCPIISIVESTATEAENLNLKKLGLLGTKFTMQSSFFQDVFLEKNIEIFTPTIYEQEYIINKYSTELVHGIANECTQVRFKEIIKNMIIRHNLDGIIIGCTEFPLVIKKSDYPKIQVLDTLEIHVDSILDFVLDEK
jgi:aspartate racemase